MDTGCPIDIDSTAPMAAALTAMAVSKGKAQTPLRRPAIHASSIAFWPLSCGPGFNLRLPASPW